MEYLITDINEINSKKSRIEINQEEEIALYKGEIRRFHIEKDSMLSSGYYNEIMTEILPKRARERCLNLLSRRSMTEQELRNKLKEGYYPEEIIDKTMNLLMKYRFIDDEYFAENYIETHQKGKSIRQIKQNLMRKGIASDVISQALSEADVDEEESIRRLMVKKRIDPEYSTEEEKTKFCAYLLRKGYDFDRIRKTVLN